MFIKKTSVAAFFMAGLGAAVMIVLFAFASSGMIGGFWLLIIGEWKIVIGLLFGVFIMYLAIKIMSIPGRMLIIKGSKLRKNGGIIGVTASLVFLIFGYFWIFTLSAMSITACFKLALDSRSVFDGPIIPYLLFANTVAIAPWGFLMDEKKISQSAVAFIGIASSGLAIALWIDVKLANMVFVAILIISLISEIIAEYWRLSKE